MLHLRIPIVLVTLILCATTGMASTIMLNGQGLSEYAGFTHGEHGGLVIIAYYPESGSLGTHRPDTTIAPAVLVQNWYGMDTENFADVGLSIITNESGIMKRYDATWNVLHISSGRATSLVNDDLKTKKYEVVSISVSYTDQNGGRLTDTWELPTGSLDNKLLDNVHLLRRTPGVDTDNNYIYDAHNGGEVIRFSVL